MASTEISAETRSRILEKAWKGARTDGIARLSVKDVAAAAGVSRQLVYFHFGNRAGLLLAMARHQDLQSGIGDRFRATRELPPAEAFEALVRRWCEYVPELLPVARALEAALITGDEGGDAWRDRMRDLHHHLGRALERVDEAERLASGWTVETATDWAWARLQVSLWDYLVTLRDWSWEECAERIARSVIDELVTAG